MHCRTTQVSWCWYSLLPVSLSSPFRTRVVLSLQPDTDCLVVVCNTYAARFQFANVTWTPIIYSETWTPEPLSGNYEMKIERKVWDVIFKWPSNTSSPRKHLAASGWRLPPSVFFFRFVNTVCTKAKQLSMQLYTSVTYSVPLLHPWYICRTSASLYLNMCNPNQF